jgi:FAD synthetase
LKKVVATGTFDIIHPGHIHYLTESRKLGDELHVIVARDCNVKHKPAPVIPEDQRLALVSELKPVDHARLGDPEDMFRPIREIDPDIITLGFNQHFDEEKLKVELNNRGLNPEIIRIGPCDLPLASSRRIIEEIIRKRCP